MMRNPYMTEEDWRWFELSRAARGLSAAQIKSLERQLRSNQTDLDVRIQLFSYYRDRCLTSRKYSDSETKLFEHVLWIIENKPDLGSSMGHSLAMTSNRFKPKNFASLREAWLEKVTANPLNASILGNAASFIAWRDLEIAADLFERAHALQPEAAWLQLLVMHCNSQLSYFPFYYRNEICERIIEAGSRSLNTEFAGAPFLTCEYVSEAALFLGQYDVVRWCAEMLPEWGPTCEQMANAYLGLVALRENNRALAIEMLAVKRGYFPQRVVLRLARELFDLGERESIIRLIKDFKSKIKASIRNHWIEQISNDELPDFESFCC